MWDEFIPAFNHADLLLMTEIYPASEEKIPGVDVPPLVEAIRAHGHRDAHFVADLDEVVARLVRIAEPGDLVITLGAGSIAALGARILEQLEQREARS